MFWVGPVLGGACAALSHEYIFNEQRDVTVSMTNLSSTPPESEEDFQRLAAVLLTLIVFILLIIFYAPYKDSLGLIKASQML